MYNTEHLHGQNYTVKALPWWVQTPTLGYRVGLDISIVVLARPHESSLRLHCVGDHVVNQTVLIPNLLLLKGLLVLPEAQMLIIISVCLMLKNVQVHFTSLFFKCASYVNINRYYKLCLLFINLLENVLESTIIFLQNCVLCARKWKSYLLINSTVDQNILIIKRMSIHTVIN